MVLLCGEDNDATRLAAAGGLAIMCGASEKVSKRVRNSCKSWLQNLRFVFFYLNENFNYRLRATNRLFSFIRIYSTSRHTFEKHRY